RAPRRTSRERSPTHRGSGTGAVRSIISGNSARRFSASRAPRTRRYNEDVTTAPPFAIGPEPLEVERVAAALAGAAGADGRGGGGRGVRGVGGEGGGGTGRS